MLQIGAEQEHHGEREEQCQKRKEKCSENIRADSEKISVDQSRERSVVQNNADRGEDTNVEGRKTATVKYTERWNIIR